MEIKIIHEDKKRFLDLLLLADEQENMIDKYLVRGNLFALYDEDLKSVCVVTKEEDGVYELKNLATYQRYQGQGYGKKLVAHLFEYYQDQCLTMYVGTGDNQRIITFYQSCGFELSHRVNNFFVDNYAQPIYEDGKQLIDMVYLKKTL